MGYYMFQFLISSLGTAILQEFLSRVQCFNSLQVVQVQLLLFHYQNHLCWFQFLIGSLGTFHNAISLKGRGCFNSLQVVQVPNRVFNFRSGLFMFQFLIGSLGTISAVYVLSNGNSFNSLQVVQVLFQMKQIKSLKVVSIPYRQSRYLMFVERQEIGFEFQFLIGSLGTLKRRSKKYDWLSFNSLQVVQVRFSFSSS